MGKRSLRKHSHKQPPDLDDVDLDEDGSEDGHYNTEHPIAKKRQKTTVTSNEKKERTRPLSRRREGHRQHDRLLGDLSLGQEGGEAASLETAVRQSLISRDRRLLDDALETSDLLVIRRTISDIPAQFLESLLQQLITRVQSCPARVRFLGPWIRELLRQHIGFCMNVPKTRQNLDELYQHASLRLRCHTDILKLKGRLDEIIYSVQRKTAESNDRRRSANHYAGETHDDNDIDRPLLYFKEGSDIQVTKQQQPVKTAVKQNSSSMSNKIPSIHDDCDTGEESDFDDLLSE